MPQKNYLFGGILLCVIPAMFLWVGYLNEFLMPGAGPWPLWVFFMLGVCVFWGVWTVILSLFKLDMESAPSYFARSIMVAGMAAMFFVISWQEKDGWSAGGLAVFLRESWNQVIPRLLFALGGALATIGAVNLFRKAVRKCRRE